MFASLLYTPHPPLEEYVYVVYLDIKLKVHVPVKMSGGKSIYLSLTKS